MEEIRPILKKAKQSITKIQQRHRSSKSCREKIEKELAKIGKNMEWTIKNIDKTGQDAVQKSVKLVLTVMLQTSVSRLTFPIAQRANRTAQPRH